HGLYIEVSRTGIAESDFDPVEFHLAVVRKTDATADRRRWEHHDDQTREIPRDGDACGTKGSHCTRWVVCKDCALAGTSRHFEYVVRGVRTRGAVATGVIVAVHIDTYC